MGSQANVFIQVLNLWDATPIGVTLSDMQDIYNL